MTALQAGVAGVLTAARRVKRITIGSVGDNEHGYSNGDHLSAGGAIDNGNVGPGTGFPPAAFGTIDDVWADETDTDFAIIIDPIGSAYAQNAFSGARVIDGDGVVREFLTAAADTFSASAAGTMWKWGTGAQAVWTSADIGEIKELILF